MATELCKYIILLSIISHTEVFGIELKDFKEAAFEISSKTVLF